MVVATPAGHGSPPYAFQYDTAAYSCTLYLSSISGSWMWDLVYIWSVYVKIFTAYTTAYSRTLHLSSISGSWMWDLVYIWSVYVKIFTTWEVYTMVVVMPAGDGPSPHAFQYDTTAYSCTLHLSNISGSWMWDLVYIWSVYVKIFTAWEVYTMVVVMPAGDGPSPHAFQYDTTAYSCTLHLSSISGSWMWDLVYIWSVYVKIFTAWNSTKLSCCPDGPGGYLHFSSTLMRCIS